VFFLNRVILAGRLKEGPDIRYTPQGKPVIFFTLSLPPERPEDESLPFENVSIRVMLVGERSESWAKRQGKAGGNVLVEGSLVQRRWGTAEGQMRREIGIIAHGVKDLK
jgi:single-stranded DNA-binding protein